LDAGASGDGARRARARKARVNPSVSANGHGRVLRHLSFRRSIQAHRPGGMTPERPRRWSGAQRRTGGEAASNPSLSATESLNRVAIYALFRVE
jgi:hypothetical protein